MICRRAWSISFLSLAALIAISSATSGEWHNSLKPAGTPGKEISLVGADKTARPIRLTSDATIHEKKAAEELQHWIEAITGVRPSIADSGDGPAVRIKTDPSLGDEGYRIAIEGDDLVLSGGIGRGVVNAVYALLEEDLGCRFYTNHSVRLPKSDALVVRPVERTFMPALKLRDPFYKCAFDPTWSLRNRTNSPSAPVGEEYGGHVDYGGLFVHTEGQLLPPEKYFKDHPDYFALDADGKRYTAQLCPTHPEVIKLVTAAVLEALKTQPDAEIVSVSKNDSAGDQVCHCERCRAVREAEGSEIGCQLVLVNAVAEAVEKQYPHVLIDTLAYIDTLQPPKTMRPRPNVAIRLCNNAISVFTPASECPFAETIAKWAAIHDRFYFWDYNTNFHRYLAPIPNVDVMADNVRFFANNHADGIMLQGNYQGPGDDDEMKSWVLSKVLWDPTRDDKALVQDFIWGHYGAAAPAMVEYEELRHQLRTKYESEMKAPPGGVNFPIDLPFLNKEFIDQATAILARAKQLAADDVQVLQRVERAELPILYVKCARGPEFTGSSYADDLATFERIARREGATHLMEGGPNLDAKLAEWKARIPSAKP